MGRVQAGRLRTKLAEYYDSEGSCDSISVEMPKGTYVLSFHHGVPGARRNHGRGAGEARYDVAFLQQTPRKWIISVVVLSVLLAAAVVGLAALLVTRKNAGTDPSAETQPAPAAFHIFWKGFLTGPEEPWVIFSNAAFTGRPDRGMRYYDPARDSKTQILDHYTGVGEVLPGHALDTLLRLPRPRIPGKGGNLLSPHHAKNNDPVFIGLP